MNYPCRRFVATFLALILILPHPALALRESQEDTAVPALERRLRSSAGLEETSGKFRETYTIRHVDDPKQWITVVGLLDHEEIDLDAFAQLAQAILSNESLQKQPSQWKTDAVRKRFLPEAIVSALMNSNFLAVRPSSSLASEAKPLDDLVGFLGQARIIRTRPWPKDRSLALPGFRGLLQSKVPGREALLSPSAPLLIPFSEGGGFVSGEARTPFILYADAVDPEAVEGAREVLREVSPGFSRLSFYHLPGGFATFHHRNDEFLLGNHHLDTVINFVPDFMTRDGKPKLVIDPLYYEEIKDLDEFGRFMSEQGASLDLILVEETERHYNPANFAMVFRKGHDQPTLLMNYAPETIQRMNLKPEAYFTLSKENAFQQTAILGGSLGCLCGLDLLPDPAAAGLEEKSQDRQWKHTHAKIIKALRSHPGGRLMATDLAKRAGVGRVALYSHDYRSLAAAESKRRAGMKRPKPEIEVREYQERTENAEQAIIKALRSHPGGRMTVAELAELADVGKLTLYNYNYRSLVETENKHRVELKPPKPAIILLGPGRPPSAAGLEEGTSKSVNLLQQVPPAVPGSVGDAVLVFTGLEEIGDLVPLAVTQGGAVAVLDNGPRADALRKLLGALPGPKGPYAIGPLESSRFLERHSRQILIEDSPQGRRKGFQLLGLRWDDLPPPVSAALESVLAYLDRAVEA